MRCVHLVPDLQNISRFIMILSLVIVRSVCESDLQRAKISLRNKGKVSPYSIAERRVPELTPVLGSQPAGDVSHKPGDRLSLLSARPAVTLATLKRAATNFAAWCTWMGVSSLPKTVTRQRRGCDLNPGATAPESSTLTTRLPSHPS